MGGPEVLRRKFELLNEPELLGSIISAKSPSTIRKIWGAERSTEIVHHLDAVLVFPIEPNFPRGNNEGDTGGKKSLAEIKGSKARNQNSIQGLYTGPFKSTCSRIPVYDQRRECINLDTVFKVRAKI